MVDSFNEFLDAVEGIVMVSKDTFKEVEENIEVIREVEGEVSRIKGLIGKQDEVRQMLEEVSAMVGEVSTTVEEMMRGWML